MKKYLILICGLVLATGAFAQQDPHFTMYMFNKQVLNPAYAGSRGALSATAMYRHQWTGIEGAPRTATIGIHSPLNLKGNDVPRVALGLYAFSDKIGVEDMVGVYAQYAYRIPVADRTVLSMALQGGFMNYRANLNELSPIDIVDQSLQPGLQSLLPNLGAGLYLYHDRYYLGVSVPHLIQNKYDKDEVVPDGILVARQYRHLFAMAGYVFDLSDAVKLKPNVLVKHVGNDQVQAPFDADFNLSAIFYDRVSVGASYRLEDAFSALLELQITKNLRAGYAYDYTYSDLRPYAGNTHEIMIGYDVGGRITAFKSPRFIQYF